MLQHLALLPLLTLAPALFAQKFQEPSKAELQMTADPAAPGAPAVYLDLQETTDNLILLSLHLNRLVQQLLP